MTFMSYFLAQPSAWRRYGHAPVVKGAVEVDWDVEEEFKGIDQ